MAIRHRPKVGEILECDFGQWAEPPSFDGHIKPEMRKRRSAKYHVPLPQEHFVVTSHYDIRDRWALADRIAVVSKERLFYIRGVAGNFALKLPPSLVSEIQIAVIGAINAKSLLQTEN